MHHSYKAEVLPLIGAMQAAISQDASAEELLTRATAIMHTLHNHGTATDLWAKAMTVRFGPTGLHQSRCNADGYPLPETLNEFPQLVERIAEAKRLLSVRLSELLRDAESAS